MPVPLPYKTIHPQNTRPLSHMRSAHSAAHLHGDDHGVLRGLHKRVLAADGARHEPQRLALGQRAARGGRGGAGRIGAGRGGKAGKGGRVGRWLGRWLVVPLSSSMPLETPNACPGRPCAGSSSSSRKSRGRSRSRMLDASAAPPSASPLHQLLHALARLNGAQRLEAVDLQAAGGRGARGGAARCVLGGVRT